MNAFHNLKVGHLSLKESGTGLSVFLFDQAMPCGALICGAAPGTREVTHFTQPGFSVDVAHGLMLTGGSAYGLDAAAGVMQWLKEQNLGFALANTVVPIVPTACVFDLDYLTAIAPSAKDAYLACQNAYVDNKEQGRIGAGTGTTVGKFVAHCSSMFGGLGVAELKGPGELCVRAYAVVNAVGDVVDQGNIIAGARNKNNQFANSLSLIGQGQLPKHLLKTSIMNTTLVAVFTNATFQKEALIRLAKMGAGGIAQATSPSFTAFDGDMVFCFASGEINADELVTGSLIQEAVRRAIINAAKIANS